MLRREEDDVRLLHRVQIPNLIREQTASKNVGDVTYPHQIVVGLVCRLQNLKFVSKHI